MSDAPSMREWLFRALSFETDAEQFRAAGIRIGAGANAEFDGNLNSILAPFSVRKRTDAVKMASLYALLFCFENSVRDLVADRLADVAGEDWWSKKVSPNIQKSAQGIYEKASANAWLDGAKGRIIDFTTFGQLVKIIIDNWIDFDYLIPSQSWLNQKMNEMEDIRNFLAHSRIVSQREFDRMTLYIEDWNRQVGL
jgi:hypothetical protein